MVTAGIPSYAKIPFEKQRGNGGKTDETGLKVMLEQVSETQKEETT